MKKILGKFIVFSLTTMILFNFSLQAKEVDDDLIEDTLTDYTEFSNVYYHYFKPINSLEDMYNNVFGEGYEYIMQHSKPLNEKILNNGLSMNLLSAITIENSSYIFLTLTDETNNRLSNMMRFNDNLFHNGHSRLLYYNETTKTAFILVQYFDYSYYEEDFENTADNLNINYALSNILTDYTTVNLPLEDLNIIDLLNSHEATITTDNIISGWGSSPDMIKKYNLDFDNETEITLTKDELNIPIEGYEGAYISNIALLDSLLRVQIKYPDSTINQSWYDLVIINNETDERISSAYSLGLDEFNENFETLNRYKEEVYYIEDLEMLNNYTFTMSRSYYGTTIETDLEFSITSPKIQQQLIEIPGIHKVFLNNETVEIKDILISTMQISFSTDNRFLLNNKEEIHSILWDNINIKLEFKDGLIQQYKPNNFTSNYPIDSEEYLYSISMGGQVIDVENLTAININGTGIIID